MVVATVAFCIGAGLIGGAGIFLLLNVADYQALLTLRRVRQSPLASLRAGRVAVEGRTEYGPSGRQIAPVTGEECAWFHVRLIREPGRQVATGDYGPDDDVLLDFSSPGGFTVADDSGRLPVDPSILGNAYQSSRAVSETVTLEHRRKAPVALPAIVPREVADDLRTGERLRLTETRVPRGSDVFALGRVSRGALRPSRAGLTVFTTDTRDRTIADREGSIRYGARLIVGFGLAGLVLVGGGAGYLMTVA